MNKTAIKKYAAAARLKLIDAVAAKMRYYGFDESGSMTGAAIEEIGGEVVQTAAFVLNARKLAGFQGTYARLVEFGSQDEKEVAFLSGERRHVASAENFAKIPGSPVAYWASLAILKAFDNSKLSDVCETRIRYNRRGSARRERVPRAGRRLQLRPRRRADSSHARWALTQRATCAAVPMQFRNRGQTLSGSARRDGGATRAARLARRSARAAKSRR